MGQNPGTKQDSYLSATLRRRLETLHEELPGSVPAFQPAKRPALDIQATSRRQKAEGRKQKAEGGKPMPFVLTPDF